MYYGGVVMITLDVSGGAIPGPFDMFGNRRGQLNHFCLGETVSHPWRRWLETEEFTIKTKESDQYSGETQNR